ncbi:SDR family NAD(P)-dependent oxidoreductase [Actinacidiphila sp. ITFR-21]|uniref:SDR family NAD(P)-dependent oxidoreductase n=1 Tax=Actinacidiphila sp. ITFR-21 TaxID=3075199 RepID=UPI002889418B|nr:SDR family oxidoreductase [Streptomyces sp. ITFR-21]WNI17847.1 SDR family oxidoreductase [Streptomyces sp. ITFR-21]
MTEDRADESRAGLGVAVVSGGSRSLGRVLVERLLADGWRVATFSRTANEFVEQTAEKNPDTFHWEAVDLADPERLRAFTRSVARRFGRVDLLVNNAGVLHQELLLTTTAQRIETLIDTNLLAPILLTQACARLMVRGGGGAVVNISSINAIRGYRGVAAYAAAKAGLDGFSRSLARELGAFNIRVNSVVPGFFESDMTANVTASNRERIQHRTPLDRLGTAEEIADAVLFLASSRGGFITGQSLVIDGGITC